MELILSTHSVYRSSLLGRRPEIFPAKKIPARRNLKTARILNASTVNEGQLLNLKLNSSALEQLDIERGVCIPFRKYTPETVCVMLELFVIMFVCVYFLDDCG